MERIRDWSTLPLELLGEIAERIKVAEDFLTFQGICTSWRKAAPKDIFTGASKAPLLLLGNNDGNDRQLCSFRNNKVLMPVTLPDVDRKRCTEAGFGWLLIQTETEDVSLLNPVSRVQIQLPSLANFPAYYRDSYSDPVRPHAPTIQGAVLSNDPSIHDSNFGVMVIVQDMMLCHWKFGDETWTKKEVGDTSAGGLEGVAAFYRGKFYIFRWLTTKPCEIFAWDPSRMDDDFEVTVKQNWHDYDCRRAYLVVSCDGKLLLVLHKRDLDGLFKKVDFEVHNIDVAKGISSRIYDLESCAIFVGNNVSICVRAPSVCSDVIKPNRIYFGQDQDENAEVGIYKYGMVSKRVKRVNMEFPASPPLWLDSAIIARLEM